MKHTPNAEELNTLADRIEAEIYEIQANLEDYIEDQEREMEDMAEEVKQLRAQAREAEDG